MTYYLKELLMKLQQLTESYKSGLNEQSTLRSELTKKEMFVLELGKEIEVSVCYCYSYVFTSVHFMEA